MRFSDHMIVSISKHNDNNNNNNEIKPIAVKQTEKTNANSRKTQKKNTKQINKQMQRQTFDRTLLEFYVM